MKSAQIGQEVKRLALLPWTLELRRNQDGSYFARVLELPGCMTEGPNELQALKRLHEATLLWLETELERGATIPRPIDGRRFSGKFTVRTSPLMHRLATETARRLGVSLNEFASEALALAAGGALRLDGKASRQPDDPIAEARGTAKGLRGALLRDRQRERRRG